MMMVVVVVAWFKAVGSGGNVCEKFMYPLGCFGYDTTTNLLYV